MPPTLAITGGIVFDPGSGADGAARDLFIADGRLVEPLSTVDQVIDARGLAVTPGAIDLRCTAAGYGQNYLRLWGTLPSPRQLGEAYARLGYTHIHAPDLTIPTANYVHQELAAIPMVDTSTSLTLNLRDFDIWLRDAGKLPEVAAAWTYLLENSRALVLRVVEPFVRYRQDFYRHRELDLEAVLAKLVQIMGETGVPLTLEASPELLAAELPVVPGLHLGGLGPALVSDAALTHAHRHLAGGIKGDMGLLPPAPRPGRPDVPVNLDLGWFKLFELNMPPDPEAARRALQLALSAPRENLAFAAAHLAQTPVSSFPELFAWLGDPSRRERDWGKNLPAGAFSLNNWVYCTRTLPAQILGLADKGHLRPGARADVALYDLPGRGALPVWPESCRRCRLLLKAGELVIDNFEVVKIQVPTTCYYRRTGMEPNQLVEEICRRHSFRPENLRAHTRAAAHWQQAP